jgi:hypothetical protein
VRLEATAGNTTFIVSVGELTLPHINTECGPPALVVTLTLAGQAESGAVQDIAVGFDSVVTSEGTAD